MPLCFIGTTVRVECIILRQEGGIIDYMSNITVQPLPGYKEVKPFVYAGFFPVSNEDYNDLKEAIEKVNQDRKSVV